MGILISSSLAAYGFARLRFPGRDALFLILLSTLMLPPQVTIIPIYIFFNRLHWVNTFKPLIIPNYFAVDVFFVFFTKAVFYGYS